MSSDKSLSRSFSRCNKFLVHSEVIKILVISDVFVFVFVFLSKKTTSKSSRRVGDEVATAPEEDRVTKDRERRFFSTFFCTFKT